MERRESTRREILDAAWTLARERGLSGLTLREVAAVVGMRAPSLYTHFPSRNAIIDAMFGQAWDECAQALGGVSTNQSLAARDWLHRSAREFFDFCVKDPVRNQLMNQRSVPGFVPSPESYAPSVAVMQHLTADMAFYGVTRREDIDLYTALVGGLIDAQLANDPGGDRWRRLLDRAVTMYADNVGL
jgi:AcrR family transcriptional regulator